QDVEEIQVEDTVPENETNSEFEFDFNLIKNEASPEDHTETISDNIETMFSLAQASIEMEDIESARQTLNEILEAGSEPEIQKAQDMLNNL
ncbi:MAG: pilus assembly protein FimV, partial [Cycloclasticus sp.]|nr:pilus assembly protein FimV [Cycloclasticus sp.]